MLRLDSEDSASAGTSQKEPPAPFGNPSKKGRPEAHQLKDFENFAHLLVLALKEDRQWSLSRCSTGVSAPSAAGSSDESKAGTGTGCSPRYLPEHALLAYFIKKSNDKRDLLALFKGMPSLIRDPEIFTDEEKRENFLNYRWNKSEYNLNLFFKNIRDSVLDLASHPEKL